VYNELERLTQKHPELKQSSFYVRIFDLFRMDAEKLREQKINMKWPVCHDFPSEMVPDIPLDFTNGGPLFRDEWDDVRDRFIYNPSFLDIHCQNVFLFSRILDVLQECPTAYLKKYCTMIAKSTGHLFTVSEEKIEEAQRLYDAASLYSATAQILHSSEPDLTDAQQKIVNAQLRKMYHPAEGMRRYEEFADSLRGKNKMKGDANDKAPRSRRSSCTSDKNDGDPSKCSVSGTNHNTHPSQAASSPVEGHTSINSNKSSTSQPAKASATSSASSSTTTTNNHSATNSECTNDMLSSDCDDMGEIISFKSSFFRRLHKKWQKISDWQFNSFTESTLDGEDAYDARFNLLHLTCRTRTNNTYTSVHLRDLRSYATDEEYAEFLVLLSRMNSQFGLSENCFDKMNDMVNLWIKRGDGTTFSSTIKTDKSDAGAEASLNMTSSIILESLIHVDQSNTTQPTTSSAPHRGTSSTQQSATPSAQLIVCGHCKKKSNSLKSCGRCKKVAYCAHSCQSKHWKVHKKDCTELE